MPQMFRAEVTRNLPTASVGARTRSEHSGQSVISDGRFGSHSDGVRPEADTVPRVARLGPKHAHPLLSVHRIKPMPALANRHAESRSLFA